MRKLIFLCLILVILFTACTRSAPVKQGSPIIPTLGPTFTAGMPTAVSIQTFMPPTRVPGAPISSPTADGAQAIFPTFTPLAEPVALQQFTPTPGPLSYTVQPGDYPGLIAQKHGISIDELLAANHLSSDAVIYPGDTLLIPLTGTPQTSTPDAANLAPGSSQYFKILPDSELVFGPLTSLLDVNAFIQKRGGYLAYYTQEINGKTLTGAQIVVKVAQNYSVNPRVLLALLEYRAQWLSNPNPAPSTTYTPIGYVDDFHQGLYRQLTWSADMLNYGFYNWKEGKIKNWTLSDGSSMTPQPGINSGTAAVQHLFAVLDTQATWAIDTGPDGFYATYTSLFGYPFDMAIEPLVPAGLTQPTLSLPFQPGEVWQFTGGPHAGWDEGSAWAALDFAPPGEPLGCAPSDAWVIASAPGIIVRADDGAVVEDLDGDGLEQTGWTLLYMHMESRDRVQAGAHVQTGDRIGHPSCEGGLANADHLHFARRYNGVWIPAADPKVPFVLGGYTTSGTDVEYDGWLTGNGKKIEAWDGRNAMNEIQK